MTDSDFDDTDRPTLTTVEGDEVLIRGEWMMDGARTLSEAALKAYAAVLRVMEKNGMQLLAPVMEDQGLASLRAKSPGPKKPTKRTRVTGPVRRTTRRG